MAYRFGRFCREGRADLALWGQFLQHTVVVGGAYNSDSVCVGGRVVPLSVIAGEPAPFPSSLPFASTNHS